MSGFSLVEYLLVIVMVGIIIILMANLPNAFNLMNKSKHLSLGREIVAKQIEDKRAISFSNLANGSIALDDLRINLLPGGSGTVVTEDCDPNICTNSEHIKQVTVTLNWQDNNKLQTISLKTFIGEGGLNQ